MNQDELSEFLITKEIKKLHSEQELEDKEPEETLKREPLTAKNAVKFLLDGTLRKKICRYCLNIASSLYELDQVFQIGSRDIIYKVTVRDMIASFHPFKVADDPNFPNRICDKCLNRTFSSYFFTQQCEQSERALRNCFDDIYDKLNKLDPIERTKKRGRQKLNPNYNILYTEHEKVIDYADPIINIVNIGSSVNNTSNEYNELQCPRCWQVLPNIESLLNHEKLHPKSMWYNCHICGKSFVKQNHLKKHVRNIHASGKELVLPNSGFKCTNCGISSDSYHQHLQHIEKHKFQTVMKHLVERNMDKLCAICLNKGTRLIELDKTVSLHGGHPELTGDRTIYSILGSTLPEMNVLNNYTGSKICENCLSNAITSYIFLNQTYYIRNRLNTCIDLMLSNLKQIVQPEGNIFIEIAQNTIMPPKECDYIDEDLLIDENDEFDEDKLKIEVLEDEFRIKSDSEESDNESRKGRKKGSFNDNRAKVENNNINILETEEMDKEHVVKVESVTQVNCKQSDEKNKMSPDHYNNIKDNIEINDNYVDIIDNPAKRATKTYMKRKFLNGYQSTFASNERDKCEIKKVCSEFLTFKKKKPIRKYYNYKFTCPLCCKHFVSEYFLVRHVLKHVNKKVECKICLKEFKSKFYLYEHTKMVHLLQMKSFWSCKICGRCFLYKNKLVNHKRMHKNIECHMCDKLFSKQKYYDSHMQRHANKLNVLNKHVQTCSFCEKECSNDNSLSVHVNKVHLQIKPYSCDMCSKQFYTERNLNCHKRVHSLFSKETCQFCSKTLDSRKSLVIHVRKHIGVKPYSCQICSHSFYSLTKMRTHMRNLHGGKFCCKLCKNVFVYKSELKNHVNEVHNMI